jgi:hypothetical protein
VILAGINLTESPVQAVASRAEREAHMFVVRETFTAKPGKASQLAQLFKQTMSEMPRMKPRVLTDFIGQFNTVVLETEAEDLNEFEKTMTEFMSRQDLRDKLKGYTELYQEGKREVFKIV